ncbi:hypothetical protein PPS11_45032 [Pseudomonas putida S11]|nr:hypothetical protein PPS11_45032 [Pseudomonas putida S11]
MVNATATDPAGNTSGQGSTTVDGVAPGTPTINLSNGSSLSGTAEPNSTVTLTDGSGNPIGEATADGSGNWTFTPSHTTAQWHRDQCDGERPGWQHQPGSDGHRRFQRAGCTGNRS